MQISAEVILSFKTEEISGPSPTLPLHSKEAALPSAILGEQGQEAHIVT